MDWSSVRAQLDRRGDVDYGTPATEAEIIAAEAVLGLLPSDYRSFLEEFGWIAIAHREICGTGANIPPYLDVVQVTRAEHEDGGLAADLIPVMNDGSGSLYCLDIAAGRDVAQVVWWDHNERSADRSSPAAPTFGAWLRKLAFD